MIGWLRKRWQRTPAARLPYFDRGEPTPCGCACHKTPGMVHVMPCCGACRKCGLLLSSGRLAHEAACTGTR